MKNHQNNIVLRLRMIVFIIILVVIVSNRGMAQSTLTGQVTDEEFKETLEKAIIQIRGTPVYTTTNREGKFKLKLPPGFYQLEAIYPGIYSEYYNVSTYDGILTPMGAIRLAPKAFGRPQQRNIAAFVNTDQFPAVVKNFRTPELMNQSGSEDFNELFMYEPSAYLLENGGSYGRSELSFRGFDPGQTNIVFNGISLNNPETGAANPMLYTGLSDWAGQVQFSAGPSSGKQSGLGYGGLINVIPFMPQDKFNVSVSANFGYNNYLKTSATIHSGKSEKNFASVLKIDRTAGDGFADQTGYEAYGLYLNLYKEINHMHSVFLTGVMKSWKANQRNRPDSLLTFGRQDFTYNRSWGLLDGTPVNLVHDFGLNPLAILSHHWHLRVNTRLVSQLYGELNNSAQTFPSGSVNGLLPAELPTDDRGQANLDSIYAWNRGQAVAQFGDVRVASENGRFINSEQDGVSLLAGVNKSWRVGFQSQLIHDFNKQTRLFVAVDGEQYEARHFGTVMDNWGADGFTTFADVNSPDGVDVQELLQAGFLPNVNKASKASFDYKTGIRKAGFSGKVQTFGNRAFWYMEGAASLRQVHRQDYFSYASDDPAKSSDWVSHLGYRFSTGLTYRLHEHHSLRFNSSVNAVQPNFQLIFPVGNNWKNPDVANENLYNAELSYVISGGKVYLAAKGYGSLLKNHSWIQRYQLENDEQFAFIYDADQLRYGAELSSQLYYYRRFVLYANGSWGKWTYQSDAKSKTYGSDQQLTNEASLPLKGYYIDNAPQLSFYVKNEMRLGKGFFINLNYYRAYNRYAPIMLHDFDQANSQPEQLKLEWYDRLGAGASFFRELRKKRTIHVSVDVRNLLNNEFINQIFTNYTSEAEILNNQVHFGKGQTWRAGLTYSF